MTTTSLGPLLKSARQRHHLTLRSVAATMGCDFTYLCKIEHDDTIPAERLIVGLARLYDLDPDVLMVAAGKAPADLAALLARDVDAIRALRRWSADRMRGGATMTTSATTRRPGTRKEPSMSELDEQAVEAAAKALYTTWLDGPGAACMEPWSDDEDDETDWQSVARNDAITSITAYLAARPTPDAAAMEREFKKAMREYASEHHEWSQDGATNWDQCKAAEDRVFALFRTAVSR